MAKFSENDLKAWLEDRASPLFNYQYQSENVYLVKIPYDENFDFLYMQYQFNNEKIKIDNKMEFAGIYCLQDGCIYNADYNLRRIEPSVSFIQEHTYKTTVSEKENKEVGARIEELIGNDKKSLTVKKVTDERKKADIAYYAKHSAQGEAEKMILQGQSLSDISYHCGYSGYELSDAEYMEYLLTPDTVIDRHAKQFIKNHQERILKQLIENDFLRKELQSLLDEPDNRIYKVRDIINAVKESGAKNVTLTIHKDDIDFTFKYPANMLAIDRSYFWNWYIPAQEREQYKELFGQNNDFHYEDITKITYGRNVIYEDASFEQSHTEALTEQTM